MSKPKRTKQGRHLVSRKPYIVNCEETATLADWMRCYWHRIKAQPEIWLKGYTPDQIRAVLHQVLSE